MAGYRMMNGLFYDRSRQHIRSHFDRDSEPFNIGRCLYETAGEAMKDTYKNIINPLRKELKIENAWDSMWTVKHFFDENKIRTDKKHFERIKQDYIMNCLLFNIEPQNPLLAEVTRCEALAVEVKKRIQPFRKECLKLNKDRQKVKYG